MDSSEESTETRQLPSAANHWSNWAWVAGELGPSRPCPSPPLPCPSHLLRVQRQHPLQHGQWHGVGSLVRSGVGVA